MLPWILLSLFSICHAYKTNVVCYGHDAIFPNDVSVSMYLHKVFFTPSSPPGLITMVMDESTSLDPRFKRRSFSTKLQDVTMADEGIYSVLFPENDKPLPVLGITVKDCSKEAWLKYGMSYSLEVSRAVSLIDYSPLNDDKVIVMWDRTHLVNTARGTLEKGNFVMDKLTQTDQGVYTFRGRRGKFLHRIRIYIEEWTLSKAVQAGEVFEFSFPLDPSEVSLAFKPSFSDDAASPFTLMDGGVLVNRWLFKERIHYVGGLTKELQITDLMPEDQGTFWVRDRHGNLAKVVELTVVSPHIPVLQLACLLRALPSVAAVGKVVRKANLMPVLLKNWLSSIMRPPLLALDPQNRIQGSNTTLPITLTIPLSLLPTNNLKTQMS